MTVEPNDIQQLRQEGESLGNAMMEVLQDLAEAGGGVPDPSAEPDGQVLTTDSGAAVWAAGGGSSSSFVAEAAVIGSGMTGNGKNLTLSGLYGGFLTNGQRVLVMSHLDRDTPDPDALSDDGFYIARSGAWETDATYAGQTIPPGGTVSIGGNGTFYAGANATDIQTVTGSYGTIWLNNGGAFLVGTDTSFSTVPIAAELSVAERNDGSMIFVFDTQPCETIAHASASTASNTAQLNALIDALQAAGVMLA